MFNCCIFFLLLDDVPMNHSDPRIILKTDDKGHENSIFSYESVILEDRANITCEARNIIFDLEKKPSLTGSSMVRVKGR